MNVSKRYSGLMDEDLRARAVQKATAFAVFWGKKKHGERQEASQFEKEFLEVFGLNFRDARLEHKLRGVDGKVKYVDLFWPGEILIEMKSSGSEDFTGDAANTQAFEYVTAIERAVETPKVVMVSDFNNIRLFDLRGVMKDGRWNGVRPDPLEFSLEDLPQDKNFAPLQFLIGREDLFCHGQLEVNQEAAEQIGKLFTLLSEKRYNERDCTVFLMRVLFCLFAEDTHIFKDNAFAKYILESIDHGQGIAGRLSQLFETLDTKVEDRALLLCPWDNSKPDPVLEFPHVDGGLFSEKIKTPPISDDEARVLIVENCSVMDWSKVSPAIFGALFQSIRTREDRRQLGEHYTSIVNIEKVLNPLFMDALNEEYQSIVNALSGKKKDRLKAFQSKLGSLQLLDPACGCGNFLIVAYEQLRNLEYRVIRDIYSGDDGDVQKAFEASLFRKVRLSQLHGIEIDLFPQMIAMTAAWLQDHLANERLSALVGKHIPTIPLSDAAHIIQGNALLMDWETCFQDMEGKDFAYIYGNPPFNGARTMSKDQKADMKHVFGALKGVGDLDYVTAWYWKAAEYMKTHTDCSCAFVSTNSITQGQQVALLWKPLVKKVRITFGYRTFKWFNESRGMAAVHCVIVGMVSKEKLGTKELFLWDEAGEKRQVDTISPYLVDGETVFIQSREKPLCNVPEMGIGCQILDNGLYTFKKDEYDAFIREEPLSKRYFYDFLGAEELLHNKVRYLLRVADIRSDMLKKMPKTRARILAVKKYREGSNREATKRLSSTPGEFQVTNIPSPPFMVMPQTSSENREYIPLCIYHGKAICNQKLYILPSINLYLFSVLISSVHMTWVRFVAGRLKSDYSYSINIVYNNFPWPDKPKDTSKIEMLGQAILDARSAHPGESLADLYDPLVMPNDLYKAHSALDKAVLRLYGLRTSASEEEILKVLFERYNELARAL